MTILSSSTFTAVNPIDVSEGSPPAVDMSKYILKSEVARVATEYGDSNGHLDEVREVLEGLGITLTPAKVKIVLEFEHDANSDLDERDASWILSNLGRSTVEDSITEVEVTPSEVELPAHSSDPLSAYILKTEVIRAAAEAAKEYDWCDEWKEFLSDLDIEIPTRKVRIVMEMEAPLTLNLSDEEEVAEELFDDLCIGDIAEAIHSVEEVRFS